MPRRKVDPEEEKRRKQLRFTPQEIVSAIEAVEVAGHKIASVEITPTGAIKISTRPRHGKKTKSDQSVKDKDRTLYEKLPQLATESHDYSPPKKSRDKKP